MVVSTRIVPCTKFEAAFTSALFNQVYLLYIVYRGACLIVNQHSTLQSRNKTPTPNHLAVSHN